MEPGRITADTIKLPGFGEVLTFLIKKELSHFLRKTLGGKSEKTKQLRSVTPLGFARAFYEANH